jgi:hypothetical protein
MIDTGYIYNLKRWFPGGVVPDRWRRYGSSMIDGRGSVQEKTVGCGMAVPRSGNAPLIKWRFSFII